jgi:hypothetical protein
LNIKNENLLGINSLFFGSLEVTLKHSSLNSSFNKLNLLEKMLNKISDICEKRINFTPVASEHILETIYGFKQLFKNPEESKHILEYSNKFNKIFIDLNRELSKIN